MNSTIAFLSMGVSLLAVLTSLVTTIRWVWRQAQTQAIQTRATISNTEATQELTKKFGLYTDKADGHLLDHEKRITRLEDRAAPR